MKSFIDSHLLSVRNDKIQFYGIILSFLLLCCHIWQFVDSHFMIQPLIRIAFYVLMIPTIFIFGREGMFRLFVAFAYVLTLDIAFFNFTPFFVLLIFALLKAKKPRIRDNLKLWILIFLPYVICVLVVCQLHKKDSSHLVIHFINCYAFFYLTWYFVKNRSCTKPLILDDDQEKIIKDLAMGKMQKEIEYFSKNTITEKIKVAIENNNLITKEQLIMRYMILNPEFQ